MEIRSLATRCHGESNKPDDTEYIETALEKGEAPFFISPR